MGAVGGGAVQDCSRQREQQVQDPEEANQSPSARALSLCCLMQGNAGAQMGLKLCPCLSSRQSGGEPATMKRTTVILPGQLHFPFDC